MFLQELFILLGFIWIMAKVFRRFGWPLIFGDILAGIIAGPLLLGWVHDTEAIRVLSELGIFFLMFHAGLEIQPRDMFKAGPKALLIAVGGTALPFSLGFIVSQFFGLDLGESLFVALGLSITAISVTVRLLKDESLMQTPVGHITTAASIADDVLSLVLFSLVLDVSSGTGLDLVQIGLLISKIALFFIVVLWSGNWLSRYTNKILYKGNKGFTLALVIACGFAVVSEVIGLHFIVGAFLAGLFIREEILDEKMFAKIEDRVFGISYSFLGPIFFATLAFHIDTEALFLSPWLLIALLLSAIAGKVIGTGFTAFLTGVKRLESLAIGVAMNSRGAVELIIASIGLERGIIGTTVFSVLVLIAFATTLASILCFRPLAKHLRHPKPVQIQLPGIESYERDK
jgi:Kef-type K+ transport system membrane component KefB